MYNLNLVDLLYGFFCTSSSSKINLRTVIVVVVKIVLITMVYLKDIEKEGYTYKLKCYSKCLIP